MLLRVGGSALALLGVLACAGGRAPSASPGASPARAPLTIAAVAGEYTLIAVDGHGLPYAPRSLAGAGARPVVSGSFTLNTNGTFRLQTVFDQPEPAPAFGGACYAEGDEVKMVWDGGGLTNITLRGDTVVLKREGAQYSYLRRTRPTGG